MVTKGLVSLLHRGGVTCMNLVMDGRRDGELRVGTRFPKFTAVLVCNGKSCGLLAALSWSRGRLGTAEWICLHPLEVWWWALTRMAMAV